MSNRRTIMMGALAAAAGVALGAYGAHGLEERLLTLGYEAELPQRLAWFETGVKYQCYHALGLILVAIVASLPARLPVASWIRLAFLLGIFLFSGSLYAMTFLPANWSKLGAVVPLGGLSFIVGWITLAVSAWRHDDD